MLRRLFDFVRSLFDSTPVHLAIVRRYADANGAYVGELYLEQVQNGISSYRMIGMSLDTFPIDTTCLSAGDCYYGIDTEHNFLDVMMPASMRVGALDPSDNDRVRLMIERLPRRRMSVIIQNRFVEHVLGGQKI